MSNPRNEPEQQQPAEDASNQQKIESMVDDIQKTVDGVIDENRKLKRAMLNAMCNVAELISQLCPECQAHLAAYAKARAEGREPPPKPEHGESHAFKLPEGTIPMPYSGNA